MSGTIFTEQVLIVQQTWRSDYLPDYDVFDQGWTQLATARREVPATLKRLVGAGEPVPLQVFDVGGHKVLTAGPREHPRPAVYIEDAQGDEVGWLIRTGGVLRPRFDLERQGRRIGSLEVADRRQRVVNVRDESDAVVADIRTITDKNPFPVPDGTDGYYLTVHREIPGPLRTLVVGCTVVLQSVIGSESSEPVVLHITFPGIPAMLDRLRRKPRR